VPVPLTLDVPPEGCCAFGFPPWPLGTAVVLLCAPDWPVGPVEPALWAAALGVLGTVAAETV
jgi:hypothetical protein